MRSKFELFGKIKILTRGYSKPIWRNTAIHCLLANLLSRIMKVRIWNYYSRDPKGVGSPWRFLFSAQFCPIVRRWHLLPYGSNHWVSNQRAQPLPSLSRVVSPPPQILGIRDWQFVKLSPAWSIGARGSAENNDSKDVRNTRYASTSRPIDSYLHRAEQAQQKWTRCRGMVIKSTYLCLKNQWQIRCCFKRSLQEAWRMGGLLPLKRSVIVRAWYTFSGGRSPFSRRTCIHKHITWYKN